jgi:hypothetical protein
MGVKSNDECRMMNDELRKRIPQLLSLGITASLVVAGCAVSHPNSPTTRATSIPAEVATPQYWLNKPATQAVESTDFERLFAACEQCISDWQFSVDRTDYRAGVITSKPAISKQFFEVWRSDPPAIKDVARSSLQTIRRTIRFEISRQEDGIFTARPKVLVEQLSQEERRLTAVSQYGTAFSYTDPTIILDMDTGKSVGAFYWFAIGRDGEMERKLADEVRGKIR